MYAVSNTDTRTKRQDQICVAKCQRLSITSDIYVNVYIGIKIYKNRIFRHKKKEYFDGSRKKKEFIIANGEDRKTSIHYARTKHHMICGLLLIKDKSWKEGTKKYNKFSDKNEYM